MLIEMAANLSINFIQPNIIPVPFPPNVPILSTLPQQHRHYEQPVTINNQSLSIVNETAQNISRALRSAEKRFNFQSHPHHHRHTNSDDEPNANDDASAVVHISSDKPHNDNPLVILLSDSWSSLFASRSSNATPHSSTSSPSTPTTPLTTTTTTPVFSTTLSSSFTRDLQTNLTSEKSATSSATEFESSSLFQLPEGYDLSEVRWINSYDELPACDEPWQIFLYVLYSLTVIIAVLGNVTAICVLVYGKRSSKELRLFLVNLSLADLTMATFSIPFTFTSFTLGRWIFGIEFCRVVQGLQITSVFVSVYTMMAIGVDRYIAIIHPLLSNRLSRTFGKLTLILIWSCGLSFGFWQWSNSRAVPMIVANRSIEYDCKETRTELGGAIFTCLIFAVTFALPLGAVSFAYGSVALNLFRHSAPGNANEARDRQQQIAKIKIIKMLATIVILFAICWLPIHILQLSLVFGRSYVMSLYNTPIGYNVYITLCIAFHWLSMANSFVNPIIYCFMSENFRSDLRFLWRKTLSRLHYCCTNGSRCDGHNSGQYSGSVHGRSGVNRSTTYYSSAVHHRLLKMRQSNAACTGGSSLTTKTPTPPLTIQPRVGYQRQTQSSPNQTSPPSAPLNHHDHHPPSLPLALSLVHNPPDNGHFVVGAKPKKRFSLSLINGSSNGHISSYSHPATPTLIIDADDHDAQHYDFVCQHSPKDSDRQTNFGVLPLERNGHKKLNFEEISIGAMLDTEHETPEDDSDELENDKSQTS